MMVVAAESAICGVGIGGFASMKALSTRNDEPKKSSRPFDKDRDGFVMGEGGACLILEELESAKQRGAKIYAEIIGIGESGDANHITSPVVSGPFRAMRAALDMANQREGNEISIDYINAHGTSTPANDKNETLAMKELFKDNVPLVSSTKGQTGHCLGAAGGIEAIVTIMAMNKGVLPPTINYETPDIENGLDLDYIPNKAREFEAKIAMSNSFGFGGTNAAVIFKKI
jgi:3-oxoacyl-[acyl-carrier-protein] synthase II